MAVTEQISFSICLAVQCHGNDAGIMTPAFMDIEILCQLV